MITNVWVFVWVAVASCVISLIATGALELWERRKRRSGR